ncbi:MAG TPA: hypothetical protein VK674_05015 [Candidatus Limnocylindria bacterium]|nr:hypothetical protein [Candidatus Limnocylindria bacterium]
MAIITTELEPGYTDTWPVPAQLGLETLSAPKQLNPAQLEAAARARLGEKRESDRVDRQAGNLALLREVIEGRVDTPQEVHTALARAEQMWPHAYSPNANTIVEMTPEATPGVASIVLNDLDQVFQPPEAPAPELGWNGAC